MSQMVLRKAAFAAVMLSLLAATVYVGIRARQGAESPSVARKEPAALVPPSDIVEVIPPDNIPSIDRPKFLPSTEAGRWLSEREPVVALELGGEARAYPVQIMMWHEIVNDTVAGEPVTVTYCPLCNSAVAFRRTLDGRTLEFGTSGKLYKSALVMYDRETESLWTHFEGLAIQGELTGTRLEVVPVQMLSFGAWRQENPDGLVLSRDTGHLRSYGRNPYDFYDSKEGPYPQFFQGPVGKDLPPMARVVGVALGESAVAYPYPSPAKGGGLAVIQDRVAGNDVVVFWQRGVASALDTPRIAGGREVGASGVFVPEAGGRTLTFEVGDGRFVDRETGSAWTLSGRAVSGPLAGERLQPLHHIDAFWFAWWAYHPETAVRAA